MEELLPDKGQREGMIEEQVRLGTGFEKCLCRRKTGP
jgi:hypothetical protein